MDHKFIGTSNNILLVEVLVGNVCSKYVEYMLMFCCFLRTAYHVAKLNKNNFCASRSRLGGSTENSSCEGAHIIQF